LNIWSSCCYPDGRTAWEEESPALPIELRGRGLRSQRLRSSTNPTLWKSAWFQEMDRRPEVNHRSRVSPFHSQSLSGEMLARQTRRFVGTRRSSDDRRAGDRRPRHDRRRHSKGRRPPLASSLAVRCKEEGGIENVPGAAEARSRIARMVAPYRAAAVNPLQLR
jgi:hypothetical protein